MTTTQQAMVVQQPQQPTTLDYYGTIQGFETGQRIAKMFAQSNLVPDTFKNDIGGCLIALEMAQRMRANVLQVMQSLYIVHGKPSFSSAFLIACFNQTKRFTPIKYEFEGKEGTDELKKEIQDYVKKHTAPYKYPRIVEFRDELPKTISGKIRRVALKG